MNHRAELLLARNLTVDDKDVVNNLKVVRLSYQRKVNWSNRRKLNTML